MIRNAAKCNLLSMQQIGVAVSQSVIPFFSVTLFCKTRLFKLMYFWFLHKIWIHLEEDEFNCIFFHVGNIFSIFLYLI